MSTPEQLLQTIKAREEVIDRLYREIERKSRQLAEARHFLRMALEYGVNSVVDRGHLTEGCAADTRKSIEAVLPKLDDRSAKKRRRRG